MLNYVASLFTAGSSTPAARRGQQPGPSRTWWRRRGHLDGAVLETARLPQFFPAVFGACTGIGIALLAVLVIQVLRHSTLGLRFAPWALSTLRATPASAELTMVATMAIAGGLAGLAGTVETLGLHQRFAPEFTGSAGFEGITVALLAKNDPLGVLLGALLLGGLYGGSAKMQFESGVRSEIIQVVQALVLVFVAAPEIIRTLYRFRKRAPEEDLAETKLATGWGG